MKKFLFVILFAILANAASAQILIAFFLGDKINNDNLEFGLNLGVNRASIINLEPSYAGYGLNMGLSFLYKFNDRLHINPMLYYSFPMGAKGISVYETTNRDLNSVLETATVQRKMSGFSLPVTVRYQLYKLTYFELGPQINLITKAQDIFTVSLYDKNDLSYTADISNQYNKFDLGVSIGISQRFKKNRGVTITARYYNSLLNVSKDNQSAKQYNSVIHLGAIIPMGKVDED